MKKRSLLELLDAPEDHERVKRAITMFSDVDKDGDLAISEAEFLDYFVNAKQASNLTNLAQEFASMDKNNNNVIDPEEFDETLTNLAK